MDTPARILNTAEKLFAEHGFDATSLRQVVAAARVNLAAVNYHFGSKEKLIRAVLSRRLDPMNRERLELLSAHETARGRRALHLETVLEALVGPPLRLARDTRKGGPVFMHLVGRALSEPSEPMQTMFADQFQEVARRFMAALQRALPGVAAAELFWRANFGIGAMAHTMVFTVQLERLSGGRCDTRDTEGIIRRLVEFIAAGMRAAARPKRGGR